MVKVGFMIPPASRRPAKLRGVEKGDGKSPIVKAVENSRVME
jgi:hypothetical protein